MADDINIPTITRRDIGKTLNEHYPRSSANKHIPYFYFEVELHGVEMDSEYFDTINPAELFTGEKFASWVIVDDFGFVKTKEIFKTTYFVKYKDENKDARSVEVELDDVRLTIRDRFMQEGHGKVHDSRVLVSRSCNYYNFGIN